MTNSIWLNGEYVSADKPQIPYEDAGFLRGLGVFDTMLGRDGAAVNPQPHFERLIQGCKTCLLYEPELTFEWFTETVKTLLQKNGLSKGHARIRTQVTAGITKEMLGKPDAPLILMMAIPVDIPQTPVPVRAVIVEDYPRIVNCVFENCKRLDYTRSYIAKHKAIAQGGNDAIITNTEGNIACATTSSLFIIEDGRLITPPLRDGVLNGITRKKLTTQHGALEESISKERLLTADGAFLANSILGLRPIERINETRLKSSIALKNVLAQAA